MLRQPTSSVVPVATVTSAKDFHLRLEKYSMVGLFGYRLIVVCTSADRRGVGCDHVAVFGDRQDETGIVGVVHENAAVEVAESVLGVNVISRTKAPISVP